MATEARPQQISWLRGFQGAGVVPWLGWLFVAVVIFWLAVNLYKEPSDFISIGLEGLTLGLVYGLIALGYSLVYGILELINFAHGDVFMLGSWISLSIAAHQLGLDAGSSGIAVIFGLLLTLVVAMGSAPTARASPSSVACCSRCSARWCSAAC